MLPAALYIIMVNEYILMDKFKIKKQKDLGFIAKLIGILFDNFQSGAHS